jgi:hypothetical protein
MPGYCGQGIETQTRRRRSVRIEGVSISGRATALARDDLAALSALSRFCRAHRGDAALRPTVFASYGITDYSRASTRISARHADIEETKLLGLVPGAILLVSEAVDVDSEGEPISYALSRFPAERMELVV